jgi:hypothetical protein
MSLDKLRHTDLQRNEEKSNHDHKYQLKIKTHLYNVTIVTLYLYLGLLSAVIISFILPPKLQFIDKENLKLMIDTLVKLSIGALIGKISNVLSK